MGSTGDQERSWKIFHYRAMLVVQTDFVWNIFIRSDFTNLYNVL